MSLVKVVDWYGNTGIDPTSRNLMFYGDEGFKYDYETYSILLNSESYKKKVNYIVYRHPRHCVYMQYRVKMSYDFYSYRPENQGDGVAFMCMGNQSPTPNQLPASGDKQGSYASYQGALTTYFNELPSDFGRNELCFFTGGGYKNSGSSGGEIAVDHNVPLVFEGVCEPSGVFAEVINSSGKIIQGTHRFSTTTNISGSPFGGIMFYIAGINDSYTITRKIHSIELWVQEG